MKIKNFLALGAFAIITNIGLSPSLAQASEIVTKDEITKSLNEAFQEQRDLGVFEANSEIEVKIVKPIKRIHPVTKKETLTKPDLTETHAEIVENACKVILPFSEKGETVQLTSDKKLLNATKLTNPRQKEMMRELIALHEGFHCEMANIDNPIIIKGKSNEFNEKLNYYFKDSLSAADTLGLVSYMGTLNENFADIAAAGSLLKKYGKDDKDLQKVLLVLETQRHGNYFEIETDTHFTHIGLNEIMKPEIQDKIINIKDGKEYKKYILEIANESVQRLMVQNKEVANEILAKDTLGSSVVFNLSQKIAIAALSEEKRKEILGAVDFKKDNSKGGFVEDLAQEFFKYSGKEVKRIKSIIENPSLNEDQKEELLESTMSENIIDIYLQNMTGVFAARDFKKFEKIMSEFSKSIETSFKGKIDEIDDGSKKFIVKKNSTTKEIIAVPKKEITNKDTVIGRMDILRERFLDATKDLNNSQKPN